MDILYLGVNMGNSGYRFFKRYPQAEYDYYQTFRWLIQFKTKYPKYQIVIKHHPGNYRPHYDMKEFKLMLNSHIYYLNNQLNSYELASEARMVVSYCSIMILEFDMPHMAYFIRETRRREKLKRYLFKRSCKGYNEPYMKYSHLKYPPAFYLDPGGRNKHFCKNIDELVGHDCYTCKSADLEVFNPYRLRSYEEFESMALAILGDVCYTKTKGGDNE